MTSAADAYVVKSSDCPTQGMVRAEARGVRLKATGGDASNGPVTMTTVRTDDCSRSPSCWLGEAAPALLTNTMASPPCASAAAHDRLTLSNCINSGIRRMPSLPSTHQLLNRTSAGLGPALQ